MPAVQLQLSEHGWLSFGAGVSGGPYRWSEGPFCFSSDCAEKRSAFAFWGRADVSLEYRWSSG